MGGPRRAECRVALWAWASLLMAGVAVAAEGEKPAGPPARLSRMWLGKELWQFGGGRYGGGAEKDWRSMPGGNRAMLLIGGRRQGREGGEMPSYVYGREADCWVPLNVAGLGHLGGSDGLSVFDPEHNVVLGIHGGAYRCKSVPIGTRAFYAGPLGKP